MSKNRANSFEETGALNNITYHDYYSRLKNIALCIFEWENVPNEIPVRWIEKVLYDYGKAIFINDPYLGYMVMKVNTSGSLNNYEEPLEYNAYSLSYNERYAADNCVIIRNNRLLKPTFTTLQMFAKRLYEVERTLDINIKAQKTPVMILCAESERLMLKNLYMQYDGNTPFIFGDKKLATRVNGADGLFKVLKTDAPMIASSLTVYKRTIWNEALTFLGINNSDVSKKERLVSDEANANLEAVDISAQTMLVSRKEACEEINKKYNLDKPIEVNMRKLSTMQDILSLYSINDDGALVKEDEDIPEKAIKNETSIEEKTLFENIKSLVLGGGRIG